MTLAVLAVLAAVAGGWAVTTLHLEGDVTELIDAEASFLQDYGTYKATFPQHRRLNVIVVDGVDARRARLAEATLLEGLRKDPQLFPRIFAPGADPFLNRHALLYLDIDALGRLVDDLAAAQPALALLNRDPSLRGLAALFDRAPPDEGGAMSRLKDIVGATAEEVLSGTAREVSWGEVLIGEEAASLRRLIIFQGSLENDDGLVARRQAETVRAIVARERLDEANGVRVAMTGRGPLSSAELSAAIESIQFAGALSLVFVILLLWIGLGSLRSILAALLTLAAGLAFTAAFAAVAVGTLNVLSLTFAVLFVGLGIDFAIHLILRRAGEEATDGPGNWAGIVRGLGPTISLCGLTTAIAFLSFWPTAFRGLAELGLIAAAGMLIAVAVSFTVLPPLLDLFSVGTGHRRTRAFVTRFTRVLFRPAALAPMAARPISVVAIALLIGSAVVASEVRFDFNSLNLQSRDSEAVQTLVSLHNDGTITPYTLTVSVPDLVSADRAASVLRAMPEVGSVKTLRDMIPTEQALHLAIIDEARILLGPSVLEVSPIAPPDEAARRAAVRRLASSHGDPATARMAAAFSQLAALPPGDGRIAELEHMIAADFVDSMAMLREALSARAVSIDTLPAALRARETGAGGVLRVVVLPREDLRDFEALGAFTRAVQEAFPTATGRPALETGMGEIVIAAFRQAFVTSAIAIFLILLVTLRSFGDAALVMVPLLLAASLTAATMVVFSIPLNVANVIVLPLLLGMGVDNGLHIVGRYRESNSVADVYRSTTPRAVVVSVLTTLLSFVALAFADHRGMASMGQLLAIAIGFLLVTTLLVLPALLAWRAEP
ncbi:MAG: MMPL family transporter [Alphaproteobacteria bacterium]